MKSLLLIFAFAFSAYGLSSCKEKTTIPRPDHVVVVIFENHQYSQVVGSVNAPFITSLTKDAAVFTNSHGVIHPSQPNYLALFSGNVQNCTDDKCLEEKAPFSTPNLAAALIKKGFTFKGYAQGLPQVGSTVCYDSVSALTGGHLYARKHCPWVNWQGTGANNYSDTVSRPMTDFPTDFTQLPTVSFVIPDMDHDMHNIGKPGDAAAIKRGDDWLRQNMSAYIAWAKTHNSLLIFTFDEDDFTAENRIPTFFIGQQVKNGEYPAYINHFDVLRTMEKMYDLPASFKDTATQEIVTIWK